MAIGLLKIGHYGETHHQKGGHGKPEEGANLVGTRDKNAKEEKANDGARSCAQNGEHNVIYAAQRGAAKCHPRGQNPNEDLGELLKYIFNNTIMPLEPENRTVSGINGDKSNVIKFHKNSYVLFDS
jgi:hypothetical protein